jgi:hypothetical protein|tara:strand:- start:1134 stop:1397 length:264 start_codon:yes stop_codon:yes gene_type:complete
MTTLFISVLFFYALKRINSYENIILKVNDTIEFINHQLKIIDDKGHFEADDEVGFFFEEMKQLGQELEQLFETEVEDGSKEEEKKKE